MHCLVLTHVDLVEPKATGRFGSVSIVAMIILTLMQYGVQRLVYAINTKIYNCI